MLGSKYQLLLLKQLFGHDFTELVLAAQLLLPQLLVVLLQIVIPLLLLESWDLRILQLVLIILLLLQVLALGGLLRHLLGCSASNSAVQVQLGVLLDLLLELLETHFVHDGRWLVIRAWRLTAPGTGVLNLLMALVAVDGIIDGEVDIP